MDERAQTAVDFGIAMGIFLVAVTIVVAFLPEMIEPFSQTPTENPLVADRVANQLTDYQLRGSAPGVLNTTCTLYFFNTTETSNPCSSFTSTNSLNDKLGIADTVHVNVTVEANVSGGSGTEVLCGDLTTENVTEQPCTGDEYLLSAGSSQPPDAGSVSVARRSTAVDGRQDVILFVRVWS
ncbi:hypothetical protein BRC81_02570 [Halobacteriales archaeon QS_1_68_20]|nr:MAG: hypothetical protein BRC81_02570 [Halobacteriales archaeon QS_1_68_20]